MKILHPNDHYKRVGGAETLLFNTLSALEERGVENVVVHQHLASVSGKMRKLYRVDQLGDARPTHPERVRETFRQILEAERPNLVHLHDIGNQDIVELSCRFSPTVQSVLNHSFYCPGGNLYLPWAHRICGRAFGPFCIASAFLTHCNSVRPMVLNSSYRLSHRMLRESTRHPLLTLSRYQADCLMKNGVAPERIHVLHPCTELPTLIADPLLREADPMILFVGRIYPTKGLNLLIQSLRQIRSPFRLVVNGDGPGLASAQALVRKWGLAAHVQFLGWTPPEETLSYYAQASVVVIPSVWPEPFGLVGIEAMSFAKPVVAFQVGGIPEWLDDGITGFLIPPGNLKTMAEKIDFLLKNPETAREMGRRGRQKVEKEFVLSRNYAPKLVEVYQQAIHQWKTTA
jgi:glycosyltransferase involved in cell wall biosynthesis